MHALCCLGEAGKEMDGLFIYEENYFPLPSACYPFTDRPVHHVLFARIQEGAMHSPLMMPEKAVQKWFQINKPIVFDYLSE